ncbi:Na+/H+ antiporter [Nocardioides hungaricus]
MDVALFLIALAVGVLAGVVVSRRIGVPAPLLLVVAGVAASFLPFVPQIHLEPEVVLIGLLPPLLYAAALSSSLVDFNAYRRPILLLSVGLVLFTTLGVGVLVHALVPGISWPVAFAVGAVVAPPDAVAATAIGRHIGLPRKIVTILEGESLFNDATALVLLRTALGATLVGVEAWRVGLDFVVAAVGGAAVGLAAYWLVARIRRRITDPAVDVALSLVVPFASYLLAEEIHASGVIAVVVAGLLLGHRAPVLQTAQSRIAERINWRTIAFLLENAVFALIGLQAQWLFQDLADSDLGAGRIVAVCLATLAAVIVLRLVWVLGSRWVLFRRPRDPDASHGAPPWSFMFLLGWAGMRGVVTLAAAFVIPVDTEYREVLLMIAFTVVAGTLLIQGLSLPMLARRLRVPAPDPLDDALARATLLQQASKAALEELDELEYDDHAGVVDLIRQRLDQRNFAAWERLGTQADRESPAALYYRIRSQLIDAERRRILEIRSDGNVPSEVVADVLAMLDVEESMLDSAEQERDETASYAARRWQIGDNCADLDRFPASDDAPSTYCQACLDAGTQWVSLRRCLECGNVGCCDSSPLQHATEHFHDTRHPVMQSAEPGEDWRWCYVHHLTA